MSDPNQSAGGPPSVPAGWYPDGQGGQRWWDGTQWTDHTMPSSEATGAAGGPAGGPAQHEQTRIAQRGDSASQGGADQRQGAPGQQQGQYGQQQYGQQQGQQQQGQYDQQQGQQQQGQYGQQQYGQSQQGQYGGQQQYGAGPGGPGGHGGYGGYGGSGKGGGVSGKLIGIIGGAVAAVLVLVLVLFLFLGGGGSPGDVARDFFDADCDEATDLLSKDAQEGFSQSDCEAAEEAADDLEADVDCDDSDFEVTEEKEDGDKATVEYEITGGGSDCETEGEIELVKEDGDWKVDSFGGEPATTQ